LRGVTKAYGKLVAVDAADVDIRKREFFTILGPSGSGKTTILRMIAGLIQPTAGEVWIDGENVVGKKPYERDISMVFQALALFPHMNVAENIAFPLRLRRRGKEEITRRIREVLEIVRLPSIEERAIEELSGGQQQRVALARALVYHPKLMLLDEPLGALDRRLREDMQLELARLHREIDITIMNVTHDQREALMLSDRMAVMNSGRIEQIGPSGELYLHPTNRFVATFIGDAVLLEGDVKREGKDVWLARGSERIEIRQPADPGAAALVLRSESMGLSPDESRLAHCENRFEGRIDVAVFEGAASYCEVDVPALAHTLKVLIPRTTETVSLADGTAVWVGWKAADVPVIA
jgi:ABC-type Fe3+/spermidine/putrescine transport system ATPase subunit